MYTYPYYSQRCHCFPPFYTSVGELPKTEDIQVSVYNNTDQTVIVASRAYGAFGCKQKYGPIGHVCIGKATDPMKAGGPGYNNFRFDSTAHCKGFAIQYPALKDPDKGKWYFYTLRPDQLKLQLSPDQQVNKVYVSEMLAKYNKTDPIGPLGCWK